MNTIASLQFKKPLLLLIALSSAFLAGCALSGNYQSARTLEKGEKGIGMTLGITAAPHDTSVNLSFPGLIPEIQVHRPLFKNMEIGGRVSPGALGFECDAKYRFLHTAKTQWALAPAVFNEGLLRVKGFGIRVPLIATLDFSDQTALNAVLFGSYTAYELQDFIEGQDYFFAMQGVRGGAGAALGLEFRKNNHCIRPMFELSYHHLLHDNRETLNADCTRMSLNIGIDWLRNAAKATNGKSFSQPSLTGAPYPDRAVINPYTKPIVGTIVGGALLVSGALFTLAGFSLISIAEDGYNGLGPRLLGAGGIALGAAQIVPGGILLRISAGKWRKYSAWNREHAQAKDSD